MNKSPKIDEKLLKPKPKTQKKLFTAKRTVPAKSINKRTASFDSFKKPIIHKSTNDEVSMDFESIAEEGIAQVVRSPVAKRGKSSTPENLSKTVGLMQTQKILKVNFDKKEENFEEIIKLRQENLALKLQIRSFKELLRENKEKYEVTERTCKELKNINFKLMDKSRELKEKVKFLKKLNTEGETCKIDLQFELEAKILSLFKEKEEKHELYLATVAKMSNYLCEFASAEEWVLSLVTCPYVKKEIEENEDGIRKRFQKIKAEIGLCQALLNDDRFVDKSYFTSISSSIVQSPSHSPRAN